MAMTTLFTETIDGWGSWSRVYQSIPAFAPLVAHILDKHGLPQAPIRHLTPGTNAVFGVGDLVVKIFAPHESGIGSEGLNLASRQQRSDAITWVGAGPACAAEIAGLRHAQAVGTPAPRILARGAVRDKYRFPYLVLPLVRGREAGDVLPALPAARRAAFAGELRALLGKLNVSPAPEVAADLPWDLAKQAAENERWAPFPAGLRREIVAAAESLPAGGRVFVHGDLTGENVLLDAENHPTVIDFGDCHLAPSCYEWPPLFLELFQLDPVMLNAFFAPTGGWRDGAFARRLALATALHDFGGDFLLRLCRETGADPAETGSLAAIEAIIARRLLSIG